jgi:hypothetical protein
MRYTRLTAPRVQKALRTTIYTCLNSDAISRNSYSRHGLRLSKGKNRSLTGAGAASHCCACVIAFAIRFLPQDVPLVLTVAQTYPKR